MKFKSIQLLLSQAAAVLERFPLVMACACLTTVVTIYLTTWSPYIDRWCLSHMALVNIGLIATLAISLFLSIKLFIESHGLDRQKSNLLQVTAALLLVLYYFTLPQPLKGVDTVRYALFISAAHLLVAVAPFLFLSNYTQAFWQYNKRLFLRIILAFIYSNTIVCGLSIALGVTDYLFEFIKIDHNVYLRLWISVVGIFNTWFFLAGVPKNSLELEQDQEYPRGLRVFTQFVLIPLVILYLGILYLYMGKIIMAWSLPVGFLSSFIIGVAVLGILTLLLVHPLGEKDEYIWFKSYRRYFYLALFPLIVLMAIAIGRRVLDYGITEERYFILLFTVWLFVVATCFTIKSKASIRLIPLTLLILVLLASWGPWSAMSVSKYNQMARLHTMLVKNKILVDGVVQKLDKQLDQNISYEIASITEYLYRSVGLEVLKPWFKSSIDTHWKNISDHDFITKVLGLEHISTRYHSRNNGTYFTFGNYSDTKDKPIKVSGYDYYSSFYKYVRDDRTDPQYNSKDLLHLSLPEGELSVSFDSTKEMLGLTWGGQYRDIIHFSPAWIEEMKVKKTAKGNGNVSQEDLIFKLDDKDVRIVITVTNIEGMLKDNHANITMIQGNILFGMTKSVDVEVK